MVNSPNYDRPGQDLRDPGFAGFEQGQIGAVESEKFGSWGNSHPEHINNVTKWGVLGLTYRDALNLAALNNVQFRGELSELDDAGTYFNMLPHKITGPIGVFYYLCTRNNNFSNRSQKGKVVVTTAIEETTPCGVTGCQVGVNTQDAMAADPGSKTNSFNSADVKVDIPPKAIQSFQKVAVKVLTGAGFSDGASEVLLIGPGNLKSEKVPAATELPGSGGRRRRDAHLAPADCARRRRDAHMSAADCAERRLERREAHTANCTELAEDGGRRGRDAHLAAGDPCADLAVIPAVCECDDEEDAAIALGAFTAGAAASGVWVVLNKESESTLHMQIKSPDTGKMLALRAEVLAANQRVAHICVVLSHGNTKGKTKRMVYYLDGRGEISETVDFTENGESAVQFMNALLDEKLTAQITLSDSAADYTDPSAELEDLTCSGEMFQHVIETDPESGKLVTVEIPVAPALAYGDLYWWPIEPLTQACFERKQGWEECKELSSREVVAAECSFGTCKFQRSQLGGYYQVHSKNNAGLIALATILCVLLMMVFVGSAVYFRKNPDKWDSFKSWGPRKYDSVKQLTATRV
jgi:hypothetical protein